MQMQRQQQQRRRKNSGRQSVSEASFPDQDLLRCCRSFLLRSFFSCLHQQSKQKQARIRVEEQGIASEKKQERASLPRCPCGGGRERSARCAPVARKWGRERAQLDARGSRRRRDEATA